MEKTKNLEEQLKQAKRVWSRGCIYFSFYIRLLTPFYICFDKNDTSNSTKWKKWLLQNEIMYRELLKEKTRIVVDIIKKIPVKREK